MEIISDPVQAYAEKFSSDEDAILHSIFIETQSHPQANMLSGHVQGKFLELISVLLRPKLILEIGTFMGYSALCLAKGLVEGGKLHTIDIDPISGQKAASNFRKADAEDKIILHLGNALNIIPTLPHPWDLVFIDADKVGYTEYYQMVMPRVRPGGLIIADNVLFHGEVLEKEIMGKNALAIHAFNEAVKKDQSVEKVLLTVRDGLLFIMKK